jgi:large subunit ribosomal protein L17
VVPGRAPRASLPVKRLFDEFGERFKDRPGGYTRIIKLGRRSGDGARLAIIELLGNPREAGRRRSSKSAPKGGSKKKGAESKSETRDESASEE